MERALSANANDAWKPATAFDGYAEKNRKGLRDHQTSKKPMPQLKKMFDECDDLSDEFKQAAVELFEDAVSHKAAGEALYELFAANPHFTLMFKEDDYLEEVQAWADRVEQLEPDIEAIEAENAELRIESMQRDNATVFQIKEDVMFASPLNSRRSIRNVAEDFEADPDNAYLLETDDQYHVGDKAMSARVAYLNNTLRNVDQHKATDVLLEVWELQKSN